MPATAVETIRTLQVICQDIEEAAAYSKLWRWLKNEQGYTVEALNSGVHYNAGTYLQRLSESQLKDNPIRSRLVDSRDTCYYRDKEWKLKITITNSCAGDCTMTFARPSKKKVARKK